jgi:hypothetical protein
VRVRRSGGVESGCPEFALERGDLIGLDEKETIATDIATGRRRHPVETLDAQTGSLGRPFPARHGR